LGKMGDVAHEGRTVLFVSHNMASMLNLCQSGLLLEHGKIRFAGSIASTVETYIQRVESEQHGKTEVDAIIAPEYTGPVRVTSISLQAARASSDNGKHNIRTREDVILRIHYSCDDVMLDYGFV